MEISFDFRPTAEFGGCNFVLIFRLRRIVSARTDVAFDTVCITWRVCPLEFAIACLSIKDFLVSNEQLSSLMPSGLALSAPLSNSVVTNSNSSFLRDIGCSHVTHIYAGGHTETFPCVWCLQSLNLRLKLF